MVVNQDIPAAPSEGPNFREDDFMQKNLAASFLALTLMFAPNAYAQSGSGDTTSAPAPAGSSIDVNVDAPAAPAPSAPSTETNINVDAPSVPSVSAPSSTTTESTTVRENTTNTHIATVDEPNDHNWGIIVGAGLIGLTVLALLLNSRRTV
jgi:hypothetical protein